MDTDELIIKGLNAYLNSRRLKLGISARGKFIIQKQIMTNETFKAYKEYIYTVWFVDRDYKQSLIEIHSTKKVINNNDDKVIEQLDIELIKKLIEFVQTETFSILIRWKKADENTY